jgi:phage terminase large subunit
MPYPHHLDFTLYPFQEEEVIELVKAIREGYDYFIEKSRDMGASWIVAAVIFWMWLDDDGFQALMGSRKEDYVDNGTLDSLFGKLDYFIQTIKDKSLLPKGFNNKKHRTYMKLVNPENGNVMKGESANKNFSRAGRYKVVFFDEFGFWPDARNSWTAAGDATKCRLAVTTPPDEPSFAKVVRFGNKIKVRSLHWRLHPKKDDDWYLSEKSRRTEEEVLHEIDISWEYSSVGKPYPEIKALPSAIGAMIRSCRSMPASTSAWMLSPWVSINRSLTPTG